MFIQCKEVNYSDNDHYQRGSTTTSSYIGLRHYEWLLRRKQIGQLRWIMKTLRILMKKRMSHSIKRFLGSCMRGGINGSIKKQSTNICETISINNLIRIMIQNSSMIVGTNGWYNHYITTKDININEIKLCHIMKTNKDRKERYMPNEHNMTRNK